MLDRRPDRRRITLGADKAYDVTPFIHALRARGVVPHIAVDGHLSKTGKPRKTAMDTDVLGQAGLNLKGRKSSAMRSDKADHSFSAMIHITAAVIHS